MENLGRYRIVRKLGRGAMGIVYLAQDPTIDRMVAIKTFEVAETGDDEWQWLRERLLAEGNRAGGLDHPNIVKIYDVVDEGERAYIVMEYVDGPTLEQYLQTNDAPDPDLTLSILHQAAEALDYANSRGIVHRDIKPANLMIDTKNAVKVTDFGIAKRAGMMTQTGRFVGTPEYMSPEQVDANPDIDGRADQFSLATVAYLLVTGRKPFEADTVTALSHMIVHKDPERPSSVNAALNKQVDAVIARAMSKTPGKRFGSCSEFIGALETALLAPPVRRRASAWAPLAAAAVLLAALIAAVMYFGVFGASPPPPKERMAVSVSPDRAVLHSSESQQFKASASGGPSEVRWSITPVVGTVSKDGLYRAPANNSTEQAVSITATNTTDGTVSATAQIQLLEDAADEGGKKRPPPPPPPPPRHDPARFSLEVMAKSALIPRGASVKEDEIDVGMGQLKCRIRASGEIGKQTALRLVWVVNNDEMDARDVTLSGRELIVPYGNMPGPGKYEIRLMSGKTVNAKTSFTIQRGS